MTREELMELCRKEIRWNPRSPLDIKIRDGMGKVHYVPAAELLAGLEGGYPEALAWVDFWNGADAAVAEAQRLSSERFEAVLRICGLRIADGYVYTAGRNSVCVHVKGSSWERFVLSWEFKEADGGGCHEFKTYPLTKRGFQGAWGRDIGYWGPSIEDAIRSFERDCPLVKA